MSQTLKCSKSTAEFTADDTFKVLRRAPFRQVLNSCIQVSGGDEYMFLSMVVQNFTTLKSSPKWDEVSQGWEFRDFLNECYQLYEQVYSLQPPADRRVK